MTQAKEREALRRHEEDTEAEAVKRLKGAEDPTEEEIESHYASGHARYRAWCRFCVRGRGKAPTPTSNTVKKSARNQLFLVTIASWEKR